MPGETAADLTDELLSRQTRFLAWSDSSFDVRLLKRHGFTVVEFASLRSRLIEPSLAAPSERASLDNPAQPLLDYLEEHPRLAVSGVPLATVGDLRVAYGYLVEPAFRRDVCLIVGAEAAVEELEDADYVEEEFGYPWTLTRMRRLIERYEIAESELTSVPLTPIEEILLRELHKIGLRPKPQFGVERWRVDFAFDDVNFAVECDGRDWHDADRDARRDEQLRGLGWDVFRLTGSEIFRDPGGSAARVQTRLEALRNDPDRLSAIDATTLVENESVLRRLLTWLKRVFSRGSAAEQADDGGKYQLMPKRDLRQGRRLDPEQEAAVTATDGVVQIIAPAGSGKTTVLVERVRELRARGVPAKRILCTTFNRKAVVEMRDRLEDLGIEGCEIRTFHGLGWKICCEEGLFRNDSMCKAPYADPIELTHGMWWRLIRQAADEIGEGAASLEPVDAKDAVSELKLGELKTPREAVLAAGGDPARRTIARIYELYEEELDRRGGNDFDDFLLLSVRHLRDNPEVLDGWQSQWTQVLVDEYQDIDPAQVLLVALLAAPEDNLFCVGDEDQTLYAWRRASVETVIELDRKYPGLARTALAHNYRCPPRIVDASRRLIEHNERRFPKRIEPAQQRHETPSSSDVLRAWTYDCAEDAAGAAVAAIGDRKRGEVVVLSRITRHLQDVALACVDAGLKIDASDRVLRRSGPARTIHAYVRLIDDLPSAPDPDDLNRAFFIPNRYLPRRADQHVASALGRGLSFRQAIDALNGIEAWRYKRLMEGAAIFDRLRGSTDDAAAFVQQIRGDGGLERYYGDQAKLKRGGGSSDVDDLDAIEKEAKAKTLSEFRAHLDERARRLAEALDRENGIELSTVHGAKGREWNDVVLFAANDDALPAERALLEAAGGPKNERATRGSRPSNPEVRAALEDERRIAYVALTRARSQLIALSFGVPSRFIHETGIEPVDAPVATQAGLR